MKSYRRFTLLIIPLLGIILFLSMSSFTTFNACEFANESSFRIQEETQLALNSDDFNLLKYHAYKALTGIEKSKKPFKNCGCDAATNSINRTKENLKNATKSLTIKDAKTFTKIALENTYLGINALENFKKNDKKTTYNTDFLTLNTTKHTDILNNPLSKKIEERVLKFKKSLDKMIAVNEHEVARNYLQETYELSANKSANINTSPGKRHYHKRIKEVTKEALDSLKKNK